MPNRQTSFVIASGDPSLGTREALQRALLRQPLAGEGGPEPGCRRCRPVCFYSHSSVLDLERLRELDHLLVFLESDVGLLPIGPAALETPLPSDLAVEGCRPDIIDLDLENALHCGFYFQLGSVSGHAKSQRVK